MNRTSAVQFEYPESPPRAAARGLRWIFPALFLAAILAAVLKTLFPRLIETGWLDALCVVFAAACAINAVARELPFQNALLAAILVGVVGGFIDAINELTEFPFGARGVDAAGPRWFGVLPWFSPLMWILVVLTARGVGRLWLRRWRESSTYGFRLLGMTAALSAALAFGADVFAAQTRHYWHWRGSFGNGFAAWWVRLFAWAMGAAGIAVLLVAVLINKKPNPPPVSREPMTLWVALNLLFAIGGWASGCWFAAVANGALAVFVPLAARRSGGRRFGG